MKVRQPTFLEGKVTSVGLFGLTNSLFIEISYEAKSLLAKSLKEAATAHMMVPVK